MAGALAEAAAAGARVIVKEAVANGRLTPGEPPTRTGAAGRGRRRGAGSRAGPAGPPPPPWPSRGRGGAVRAVTVEQLDSNVAAEKITLPPGVLDELATLAQPAGEYWAARSRRPWA